MIYLFCHNIQLHIEIIKNTNVVLYYNDYQAANKNSFWYECLERILYKYIIIWQEECNTLSPTGMPYHLNTVRDWRGLLEVCNITPVFIGYLDIYVCLCIVSIMSYTMLARYYKYDHTNWRYETPWPYRCVWSVCSYWLLKSTLVWEYSRVYTLCLLVVQDETELIHVEWYTAMW